MSYDSGEFRQADNLLFWNICYTCSTKKGRKMMLARTKKDDVLHKYHLIVREQNTFVIKYRSFKRHIAVTCSPFVIPCFEYTFGSLQQTWTIWIISNIFNQSTNSV